ncbi:MAG TPA: glycosyltransferase family 1 protein [Burkholderiaceae bacterium]|nr:glycosyltransferase family 1 protein [Burkholderiaceae bacterium]
MIRVGFGLIGGGRGTGGYNYLLNLLRVLTEHQAESIAPVLLLGTDEPEDDVTPFRSVSGLTIARSSAIDRARKRAALTRSLALGADSRVLRVLDEQRIDVLFESAQFFGWRVGVPTIAWIPDFQHRHLPHMFSRRGLLRREIGFRAQMISGRTIMLSSEDARGDCERFYPSSIGRTRVVHFAVPPGTPPSPEESRAVARSHGLPERFFYMPNQFSKHKNHLLVLDALARLSKARPDIVVVASGKTEDERDAAHFPAIRSQLEQLGLQERFRILGMLPYAEVRALMRASSALLNPSLFEGWSTPVEEARALGVPLLLSDLPVHVEQAGQAAAYFRRDSVESLVQMLVEFQPLTDAEREARLAAASAEANSRVRRFGLDFAKLAVDLNATAETG